MDKMDDMIVQVKMSVVVAVWEAKIKLVEDLQNLGSWNVIGWHEAMSKFTDEPAGAMERSCIASKGSSREDGGGLMW